MKKKGAILSAAAAILSLTVLGAIFVRSADPYVTIQEAKKSPGDGLHVAGQIQPGSIQSDLAHQQMRFTLKDDSGQILPIVYTGAPVSNLGTATKVVAIGGMKNGSFSCTQLLVKCPSKYEAEKLAK